MSAQWRTIDTAPKDGTQILLGATSQTYRGQHVPARSTQGYWDAQKPLPGDYASDSGEFIGEPGGVPFWMSEDGGFTEENPPTHWQPMPAPPEFDDPGVAALPPIGTPGYGAALIALPHDYPLRPVESTLPSAVLALNAAWNNTDDESVIAGHLDLCRRLALLEDPKAGTAPA